MLMRANTSAHVQVKAADALSPNDLVLAPNGDVSLLAVFPANVNMALHPERYDSLAPALLWARLPVQGLFAWLTWRGTE